MKNDHAMIPLTALRQDLLKIQSGITSLPKREQNKIVQNVAENLKVLVKEKDIWQEAEIVSTLNSIFQELTLNYLMETLAAKMPERILGNLIDGFMELNAPSSEVISVMHHLLNLFRRSAFLRKIYDRPQWPERILRLIQKSNFTVSQLLTQRVHEYPHKTLYKLLQGNSEIDISYQQASELIHDYARGIAALIHPIDAPAVKVAFLTENSLQMVLLDMACLTSGIVNIMIPANSVPSQIEFILNQTGAQIIFVSNDKQLAKLKSIQDRLPNLQKMVLLQGSSIEDRVITLEEMLQKGNSFSSDRLRQMQQNVKLDDLASVMYTSGTTGEPKGIMFSYQNIIYKRFCRAMALPEIGDRDRYLSYLPLYHTFGRWLEMMGSLFWGAQYTFMENPALPTMIDNMQRSKPTIFISIPKKWLQLYEYISSEVDIEFDEEEKIAQAVKRATGGELRWGLSAAGYLDPAVFRFFQRYGVHLMSGFGMTEATGGITMTPPDQYVENSLGKPLPGIEVKLAPDGEMMIRGPYVMMGYYGWDAQHSPFVDGWFPTGDIMRQDEHGFYEIVDRKKEIYKNIKGETIAPQRIENLFRDFEYVQQVFLVGDHLPFNTALIYPNYDHADGRLKKMSEEEKNNYFSSVVVTVNKFLAPFERIVDFRIVERPFQLEKGELTPKGTYKRRVIEKNFADLIKSMYSKNYISLFKDGLEIRVPNWFLREKGCLISDLSVDEHGMTINKYKIGLRIKKLKNGNIQIGNYSYRNLKPYVDFQIFLANPFYWLGNQELIDFAGDSIFQWYRLDAPSPDITFARVVETPPYSMRLHEELKEKIDGEEKSLFGLNLAVTLLHSRDERAAASAIEYLRLAVSDELLPIYDLALEIIRHPEYAALGFARKGMFKIGTKLFSGKQFKEFLQKCLTVDPFLLDQETIDYICRRKHQDEDLAAIHGVLKEEVARIKPRTRVGNTPIPSLLDLLAEFGIQHPTRYKRVRQLIVRYQLREDCKSLSVSASIAREKLLAGFRKWLGENQRVAVDVETGEEYQWRDVVIFDEAIRSENRIFLLNALSHTSLLREAIFLLSGGNMVRLYDIPPGGIWISPLEESKKKSVYRISVQTRYQGSYDFVLNVNHGPVSNEVVSEMNWLIHAGAPAKGLSLVEDFGGFWREYNLWTEDYYHGDTVQRFIQRTLRRKRPEDEQKLFHLWPFFIRTAIAAHVNFLRRTGYKLELSNLGINNIVIPHHDYQTGMRIVSIAHRRHTRGLPALILRFYRDFVYSTQKEYPFLKQQMGCEALFAGILDVEGEKRGLDFIRESLAYFNEKKKKALAKSAELFIEKVERFGFVPKALYFAVQRFHRWLKLNESASLSAQAQTLNELYDTYQLYELEEKFPETRIRFFLDTVFSDSDASIKNRLRELAQKQHDKSISKEEMLSIVSNLQDNYDLNEKEKFFLSRLSYPHLKPTDSALLVSTKSIADVVVRLEDYDGIPFFVRKPVSPKEISSLHQLFLEANLPVSFRPEHRFIVAVSERGFVIGGLFYKYMDTKTVYMEKIVVSGKLRRKGISDGIMKEFFNRLRDEKVRYVTTGFFRPEYFYRFGFKIEKKYAGLVKDLEEMPKQEEEVLR